MGVFNWKLGFLALGQCCFSKLQDNFKIGTHTTAKGRDQGHREEKVRIGERKKERKKNSEKKRKQRIS